MSHAKTSPCSFQPSPRTAIVKFQRGIQQGLLGRISRTAVMEYHGFGIISEGIDSGCHYMIVGVQGDWTRSIANDPPKYLWTRQMKVSLRFRDLLHSWRTPLTYLWLLVSSTPVRGPTLSVSSLPPRHLHLHGFRYRRSAIDMRATRQLVPYLDRFGPGEDIRTGPVRYDQAPHPQRAVYLVRHKKRGTTTGYDEDAQRHLRCVQC